MLKYGYSGFKLEILEYCASVDLLKREQYYLDLFNPEYNLLKVAGSRLGSKYTEATKDKMRGIRGTMTISPERRAALIDNIRKFNAKPMEQERLEKLRDHIYGINAKRALAVEVTETETGNIVKYESVRQAARELVLLEVNFVLFLKIISFLRENIDCLLLPSPSDGSLFQ